MLFRYQPFQSGIQAEYVQSSFPLNLVVHCRRNFEHGPLFEGVLLQVTK